MGGYDASLFSCFNDIQTCLCGYFCLPCLIMRTRAWLEGREATCNDYCFACIIPWLPCGQCWYIYLAYQNRKKVQEKYGIDEQGCCDCLSCWFCFECCNCQDANEIIAHGDAPHQ